MHSLYSYGSDYTLTTLPGNVSIINAYEIKKKDVTYLNDEKTPCQPEPRIEEINTCIQHHIEKKMACQLPWHKKSTIYTRCTKPEQYDKFINMYNDITGKQETQIAAITGCLPSCKRAEFEMKLICRMTMPLVDGERQISGYFYYPTRRYIEKYHFYAYNVSDFLADMGGLLGLMLGYSALTCYDAIIYLCNKAQEIKIPRKL